MWIPKKRPQPLVIQSSLATLRLPIISFTRMPWTRRSLHLVINQRLPVVNSTRTRQTQKTWLSKESWRSLAISSIRIRTAPKLVDYTYLTHWPLQKLLGMKITTQPRYSCLRDGKKVESSTTELITATKMTTNTIYIACGDLQPTKMYF